MFFPFVDGVTLKEIPEKFNEPEALTIAETAFYMYGQALGVLATTRVELDNGSFQVKLPDRHIANVMIDSNFNLYLIDIVDTMWNYYVDHSLIDIYKACIVLKKACQKKIKNQGLQIIIEVLFINRLHKDFIQYWKKKVCHLTRKHLTIF